MPNQIIIIENDPNMQQVFASNLKGADWDILIYNYADAKLSTISLLHPALIILDFKSVNAEIAWGFLQMLKMDDSTTQIPIIITSNLNPLTTEIRNFLTRQYIQVIYTPIEFDKLIALIKHTLSLSNRSRLDSFPARSLPILVVDDNEDIRENVNEILSLEGYQVVTANNGLLALEAVYTAEHSLILLDIQMPIMDGFEFLRIYGRQVREHRPTVILSANTEVNSQRFPNFVVELRPYS